MARGDMLPGIIEGHSRADSCRLFLLHKDKFSVCETTGCWVWMGASQSNGYGRAWNGSKTDYAHRVMYQIYFSDIPAGMDLDHLCRNRACVNPLHLEPVSRSENLHRGTAGENIAAPHREKTHCPQGHPYSGDNLAVRNGRRHCKACARDRYHKRKTRNA